MNRVRVDAKTLAQAIRAVLPAVSRNKTRPTLQCVLVSVREKGLVLVATDTHRMALCSVGEEVDVRMRDGDEALVLASSLKKTALPFLKSEKRVEVSVKQGVLRLKGKETCAPATDISGFPYPDWTTALPREDLRQRMILPRQELLDRCREAEKAGPDGQTGLSIRAVAGSLALEVTVSDPRETSALEPTGWVDLEGLSRWLVVTLNPTYLREALQTMAAEAIALETDGPAHPVVICSDEPSDPLLCIMPKDLWFPGEDCGDLDPLWGTRETVPVRMGLDRQVALAFFRKCAECGQVPGEALGEIVGEWVAEKVG